MANRRIVRHGPSTATGSITAHTRDPSGRRASTVGFVRSIRRPIGRRMCSMAVVTAGAAHRRDAHQRAGALDPHIAAAVDDHLVDRRIAEPSLEPTQRRAFGDHVDHAAPRNEMINDFGRRAISKPASTARATAGSRRTSATTGTPSACSTSLDVNARPGSSTSTIPVGRIVEVLSPADRDEAGAGDQQGVLRRLVQRLWRAAGARRRRSRSTCQRVPAAKRDH